MDQLLPVLVVTTLITFILIKQIKHITGNLPSDTDSSDFKKYANFSVSVQGYIRIMKTDIDSSKKSENAKFVLKEGTDEEKALESLSDFLRKLVFFETLLAKQKTSSEIESELFTILDTIDSFVRDNCVDGEELADELKELLFNEFQNA